MQLQKAQRPKSFISKQHKNNALTARQFHWADSDLCNRGRVEKVYSPVAPSHSDLSKNSHQSSKQ